MVESSRRTQANRVLVTEGLSVSYGGVRALDGVDLEVRAGEMVGLIGPNGAGKTTFIDAMTGMTPSDGRLLLGDTDLTGVAPHRRARAGLARTWQSLELFGDLTVRENLTVVMDKARPGGIIRDLIWPRQSKIDEECDRILDRLDLADVAERTPDELSLGQRKVVGVARGLAARPTVLLLDEPAAGLDSSESVELGERLAKLRDGGLPILLVDHDMGLVLTYCDYIYVLEFGRIIAEGDPSSIRTNDRVIQAYLGRSAGVQAAGAAMLEKHN